MSAEWARYAVRNVIAAGYFSDEILEAAVTVMRHQECVALARQLVPHLNETERSIQADPDWNPSSPESFAREINFAHTRNEIELSANGLRRMVLALLSDARLLPRFGEVAAVRKQFGLSAGAARVLAVLFAISDLSPLESALKRTFPGTLRSALSAATRLSEAEVRDAIGPNGVLQMKGLVGNASLAGSDYDPAPEPHVVLFLNGDLQGSLSDYICEPTGESPFATSDFPVRPIEQKLCVGLLHAGHGCNLLIHGRPGVGKTEYARALCDEAGMEGVKLRREQKQTSGRLLSQLFAALQLVDNRKQVLVVDEAETLLATAPRFFLQSGNAAEKGWVNELMDSHGKHVIWIANSTGPIDSSTRRRFDYNVAFGHRSAAQRTDQWRRLVNRHGLNDHFSEQEIERIATEYVVPPGSADRCLAAAAQLKEDAASALPRILEQHITLTGAGTRERTIRPAHYDPEVLQTTVGVEEITRAVRRATEESGVQSKRPNGVSILFSGPPGTGKTALAGYLAEESGIPMIERRASDLVSPYVGQTERNLADAFQEAAERSGLLLIDEIDSFLRSRERAVRSWEISQVNELLKQMESFQGVFVGCTNLPGQLDAASLRRFTWKVEFAAPSKNGLEKLFARYFPNVQGVSATDLEPIMGATPGDFAVVARRVEAGATPWGAERIVEALQVEIKGRASGGARRIGFGVGE